MELKLYLVTAFPKKTHGGNPAGVVIDADFLNEFDMQAIAQKVGFSETAFVLKSDVADFKVRFFTPMSEVGLCGHATIATYNLLRDLDMVKEGVYTQETNVGVLNIEVKEQMVFMEQNPPIYGEFIDPKEIEECFKDSDFVDSKLPIRIMSTGMKEIFVPVKSVNKLHSLIPLIDKIEELSLKYNVIGVHCFSTTDEALVDAYGRNFAPIVGINEESATGTSNGALGCYLNNYVNKQQTSFVLRQGYSMKKESEILTNITLENETVTKVYVGGTAKRI